MNLKKILIMKTIKNSLITIAVLILAITFSCSKDNTSPTTSGRIELKAKATLNNLAAKNSPSTKNLSNLIISSFKINIKNIEFERDINDDSNHDSDHDSNLDEESNLNHSDSTYTNVELQGPFELDLVANNTSITIATTDIPNNNFDEIEFELHKSTDPLSSIYGKSIEIKGDINGTPFIFWTNNEEEMKVNCNKSNTNIIVDGSTTTAIINFDLSAIFGATSLIDFSIAIDGNGDGIIEISSDNIDGNIELAYLIKNLLEENSEIEND